MSKPIKVTNLTSLGDQVSASIAEQIHIISSYYNGLIADNIPTALAQQLTMQFAGQWWDRVLNFQEPQSTDDETIE